MKSYRVLFSTNSKPKTRQDICDEITRFPDSYINATHEIIQASRDLDKNGEVRQYWMDIAPGGSGTLKVYSSKTTTPFMPDRPELVEPKQPNLTVSNINELKSPSSDQAGLALQAAVGLQGKSQLAGDVENSKVSAFADPEDPNNLAERGILARTLAGQLG